MSYHIYHQSIDDATLTYSATAETNYPTSNLKDRNKNTFFKDTNIAANSVDLIIDFGAARACNHVILGNYLATAASDEINILELEYSDNSGFSSGNGTSFSSENIYSSTLTNYIKTFTSQTKRYWRLTFYGDPGVINIDDLQIGTIFLGTRLDLAHSPELGTESESGYKSIINEAAGGSRYSNIFNTTNRRRWSYDYKYINSTEKGYIETWRDNVYMTKGLSHRAFYFSDDTNTTLYLVRKEGLLELREMAYQAWETKLVFDEEL